MLMTVESVKTEMSMIRWIYESTLEEFPEPLPPAAATADKPPKSKPFAKLSTGVAKVLAPPPPVAY